MLKDEFILRAKKAHGDKFDYSLVPNEFKAYDKISITCPKHGEFQQTACEHYKGKGCRKCKYEKMGNKMRITKDDFIKRANEIHKCKYDYSKCEDFNTNKDYVLLFVRNMVNLNKVCQLI